ncbi:hypothetical protein DSO57_1026697 [Entomophthora muscae]|uniref:Uncharacterized protein n=2 Tax=Entomophthora muscae TaxID=34485 RepID=A0ACC2S1W1_9FUNG|nr:hypothetical protein DSO57_1034754 [Entomophthora muscae]KAJ9080272.1 hypothetical protein DSO57_1026697 [Entomophthora muscae]
MYPMLGVVHNVPAALHIPPSQDFSFMSTSPTKSDGFESQLQACQSNKEDESLALLLKVLCLSSCQGLTHRDIEIIMSFYQSIPAANTLLDIKYLSKLLLLQPLTGTVRALLAAICSIVLFSYAAYGNSSVEAMAYYSFASSLVQFKLVGLLPWEVECLNHSTRLVSFITDALSP